MKTIDDSKYKELKKAGKVIKETPGSPSQKDPQDPISKVNDTLKDIKALIGRGLDGGKDPNIIASQVLGKIEKIMGANSRELRAGLEDVVKAIGNIKFPEPAKPLQNIKVRDIKRDVNDLMTGFDAKVER